MEDNKNLFVTTQTGFHKQPPIRNSSTYQSNVYNPLSSNKSSHDISVEKTGSLKSLISTTKTHSAFNRILNVAIIFVFVVLVISLATGVSIYMVTKDNSKSSDEISLINEKAGNVDLMKLLTTTKSEYDTTQHPQIHKEGTTDDTIAKYETTEHTQIHKEGTTDDTIAKYETTEVVNQEITTVIPKNNEFETSTTSVKRVVTTESESESPGELKVTTPEAMSTTHETDGVHFSNLVTEPAEVTTEETIEGLVNITMIGQLRFPEAEYLPAHSDPNSEEYKAFEADFTENFQSVYNEPVKVIKLSPGSVMVDFETIVISHEGEEDKAKIDFTNMFEAAISGGKLGELSVDVDSLTMFDLQDGCKSLMCLNNGNCTNGTDSAYYYYYYGSGSGSGYDYGSGYDSEYYDYYGSGYDYGSGSGYDYGSGSGYEYGYDYGSGYNYGYDYGIPQYRCLCSKEYSGDTCQYVAGCNLNLKVTDMVQKIATIGYPYGYESNSNCLWNLEAPSGESIVVYLNDIQLELEKDFLTIGDEKYSSNTYQVFKSISNTWQITFSSDEKVSLSGVLMSYSIASDKCVNNPCENGATCTSDGMFYTCTCNVNWTGTNCTEYENSCITDPCVHGTCADDHGDYICNCDETYTGKNCSVYNYCYLEPCVHGQCVNNANSYTCLCDDGYGASNCEEYLSSCEQVYCLNDGKCNQLDDTNVYCRCHHLFTGSFCETALCGVADRDLSASEALRIIGGTEVKQNAWPWTVSIRFLGEHTCGGTLINEEYLITAAHCEVRASKYESYTIWIGAHHDDKCKEEDGCYISTAVEVHAHPRYNEGVELNRDIAIIRFEPAVTFGSTIQPVCLPEAFKELSRGTLCYTIGLGDVDDGSAPDVFRQVEVPTIDQSTCMKFVDGYDENNMICAGDLEKGGIDSCQGDSGGPYVCRETGEINWRLYGIVSFGNGCGSKYNPGAYTKVSSFITWIESIIEN